MTHMSKLSLPAAVLAMALPGAALADAHEPAAMNSGRVTADNIDNLIRSSNLIGGTVYTMTGENRMSDDEWNEMTMFDEAGSDWETIGTVEDVVLSRDGQLTGFVVEDAGFLGIGDDSVLLEMGDLRMVGDGMMSDDIAWVTNISEEQFEEMPEVDENWF